jgi:tetratricopeptide (TPR) repeat protein
MLIDGSAPAADPRLAILRARAYAGLHWHSKAEAEYGAALKMWPGPPDRQILLERHRNRGLMFGQLQEWSAAAAAFARARELQPDDADLWQWEAVAHLGAGETSAYRRTCAGMEDRFGHTGNCRAACNVLYTCLLRDDAVADMAGLLPLTRVAARAFHWGSYLRGAALYRAGRYAEAVESFQTTAKTYRPRVWDWCFLAMAHHRLGHADEARRCLTEARRWIEQANSRDEDDPSGTRPAWGAWHERVVYPLLLREAERLVQAPITPDTADR